MNYYSPPKSQGELSLYPKLTALTKQVATLKQQLAIAKHPGDPVGAFIAHCCILEGEASTAELLDAYTSFCNANGIETSYDTQRLGLALTKKGFKSRNTGDRHVRTGISLAPVSYMATKDWFYRVNCCMINVQQGQVISNPIEIANIKAHCNGAGFDELFTAIRV